MKKSISFFRYMLAITLMTTAFSSSYAQHRIYRNSDNRYYGSGYANHGYRLPHYFNRYVPYRSIIKVGYNSFYRYPVLGIGLRFTRLPFGYTSFYFGNIPYYYFGGTYYRNYNNGYQVVIPPVGARVASIPQDARLEVINDETYYQHNGTYYKELQMPNGSILYEVMDTNIILNSNNAPVQQVPMQGEHVPVRKNSYEKIGYETEKLPSNCKAITLNEQRYYQSPTGWYYQEMQNENGSTFKIVGSVGGE